MRLKVITQVHRAGLLTVLILLTGGTLLIGGTSQTQEAPIPKSTEEALGRISAESMRGHLSFIASDSLEGRNTPSRGLDIAALYIAAQFRRAGLEPAGDDGYFQTAKWLVAEPDLDALELKLQDEKQTISVLGNQVSVNFDSALSIERAGVFKVDCQDRASLNALSSQEVGGKVVLTELPDLRRADRGQVGAMFRARNEFLNKMESLKPALIVSIDRHGPPGLGSTPIRLIDPENRQAAPVARTVPMLTVHDARVVALHDALKPGASSASLTLKLPPPVEKQTLLRNVVGVVRGADPVLRDTCVLVTAHYDHIGIRPGQQGDNIFNGANDNGSGTVSVIELASALASMKERPGRSIVFMTFFGEERGFLGARYYTRHAVFPIEKTVANINLEHVGRTDSTEGPQVNNASLTGYDFSEVGAILKAAGEKTGIKVYKHERNSDSYFDRSDNQALADVGVPAHTLCTAFDFPDYHGAGDHWEKIDYDNMARVNRMIALAVLMIANNPEAPKWNESNPKVTRYVEAWKKRQSAGTGSRQ